MISRRDMLKVLGATTAGLSLPGYLNAAESDPPKRVVFIYTPQGLHGQAARWDGQVWDPSWAKKNSQTDFEMKGVGEPLQRHKSNLVVMRNIAIIYSQAIEQGEGKGINTHLTSKTMLLTNQDTASFAFGNQVSKGESLDLFLGNAFKSATPLFPSLQLGVAIDDNITGTMTFKPDGTFVKSYRDPVKVYGDLFPDTVLSTTLAKRTRVLAQSSSDMGRFLANMPQELKPRVESMIEGLHTLERRLEPSDNTCIKPSAPSALNINDPVNAITQSNYMNDLIMGAFKCDLTRVVSLVFQGTIGGMNGGRMGGSAPEYNNSIHSLSHLTDPTPFNNAKKQMFEQIAKLADRLKNTPEGSGTMLDNTLLVLVTEETGGHQMSYLPFVTIGGKNLGVNVGNFLELPTLYESGNGHSKGFAHGNLLRSIIVAMGLPNQSFGNPAWSDKLVPGFLV